MIINKQADKVFGQPDFTSVNPDYLNVAAGVAFDSFGNLYVADMFNHRVVEYDAPLTSDTTIDRVFGGVDPYYYLNAWSLNHPARVALDSQGNLYISDYGNHRVLEYDSPLTTDTIADRVFGQPDFTSNVENNAGISASSLYRPQGLIVDSQGNLYVADSNNRVLVYNSPLTSDRLADRVLGQPNFVSGQANNGGVSASSLYTPSALALDGGGNLYVCDYNNHRVLRYDTPMISDAISDQVFGQPNFSSSASNNGGISATSLYHPFGVALDLQGSVYIVDQYNNRMLEYDHPLTSDTSADQIFGQPDFTSNANNNGGISSKSLSSPHDVAFDSKGNMAVADGNNRVLLYLVGQNVFLPLALR